MKIAAQLTGIALAGLVTASLASVADASPASPPVGNWATRDQRAVLLVTQNGRCMVMLDGKTTEIGPCSWRGGEGTVGILTIANAIGDHRSVNYTIAWQTYAYIKVGTLDFYRDQQR
jgi:hypothetical protein